MSATFQVFCDTREDYLSLSPDQWCELRDGDWLTFPANEEPPLEVGTRIVFAAEVSLPFTEEELAAEKAPRGEMIEVPIHWLDITEIRRTAKLKWRLVYRVTDFRPLWLKAGTPKPEGSRLRQHIWTPVEEHGLTGTLSSSLDPEAEIVTGDYLNVLEIGARLKRAEREREDDPEFQMERDLQKVQAEIRELAKRALKMGVDPMHALAPIARAIVEEHDALKDAV